jgi:hypothetical protein
MNIISGTYHKIMEKIYWKFGYVYLPEGDTFKDGVGETLTEKQKDYFLKLCDKYMERYNDIFWDGLPFAMWRREDQIKILVIIGVTAVFLILYIYLILQYGGYGGHTQELVAENIRVDVQLR